jgi:putative ABC transport system ATP-binding protein
LALLELNDIHKNYLNGNVKVNALKGVSLSIEDGSFVSIMGPSGSGKSTLLNILGCLDTPSRGSYRINDQNVEKLNDAALSDLRNKFIGFVFQQFHLISGLNALENVELPLIYQGVTGKARKEKAQAALEAVGLGDRLYHRQSQLSGGEQQRVVKWIKAQNRLLLTDTTMRDAHQSLMATRLRTVDMLRIAEATSYYGRELFSLEMWGGATLEVEITAVPSPPRTFGISSFLTYTLNPGLLILLIPVMTFSLLGPYLRYTLMIPCLPSWIYS